MELINFTALIQIYAAFAFAYISIDTFHKTINRAIFKSSKILENRVKSITEKFEVIENNFTDMLGVIQQYDRAKDENNIDNKFFKKFENQFNEFNSEQRSFRKKKEDIDEKIKKWKAHVCFKQACLYSAIFCLVCLYAAGLLQVDTIDKNIVYTILLFIGLLHIGVSILFAIQDTTKEPNEVKLEAIYILYFWAGFSFLAFFYYLIFQNTYDSFTNSNLLTNITLSVILVAPLSLYISYFMRFLWIHKKCRNIIDTLVGKFQDKAKEQVTVSNNYKKIVKEIIGNIKTKEVSTEIEEEQIN